MKVKIGTLDLMLDAAEGLDISKLALGDLLKIPLVVKYSGMPDFLPEERKESPKPKVMEAAVTKVKWQSSAVNLLIKERQIGEKTAMMSINHALGTGFNKSEMRTLPKDVEAQLPNWMHRQIEEDAWAVYLGRINLPYVGHQILAVGLTESKRLAILGMQKTLPDLLKDLMARGFKMDEVKLLVIPKSFEGNLAQRFPNARIAFDWQEFMHSLHRPKDKEKARKAMTSNSVDESLKLLSDMNAPVQLLTHYEFEKVYWRVLKTISPIRRIEKDLRARLHVKLTPEQVDTALALFMMRTQLFWDRIPIDSNQLNSLKYIQSRYNT